MATKASIYGPGKFLKATPTGRLNLPGEPPTFIGQIARVTQHEFDDNSKQAVIQWADPNVPPLGLNKTNWETIEDFSGRHDDEQWGGLWIEVFVVRESRSQSGYACRVRSPQQQQPAPPMQQWNPAPPQQPPPQWNPAPPQQQWPQQPPGPPQVPQGYQAPPMPQQPAPQQAPPQYQQQQFQPPPQQQPPAAYQPGLPVASPPSPAAPAGAPTTFGAAYANAVRARLAQIEAGKSKSNAKVSFDVDALIFDLLEKGVTVPGHDIESWPLSIAGAVQESLASLQVTSDIPF